MPFNDPTITASCDSCDTLSEEMELCAVSGGGWDERNVEGKLKRWGWKVDGRNTLCEDCAQRSERARGDALAKKGV